MMNTSLKRGLSNKNLGVGVLKNYTLNKNTVANDS